MVGLLVNGPEQQILDRRADVGMEREDRAQVLVVPRPRRGEPHQRAGSPCDRAAPAPPLPAGSTPRDAS